MFDLRNRYSFDASESQIAEGMTSPYGQANSHANCVPASFTTALVAAGLVDIDPQQITAEMYGPSYRGGTDFAPSMTWILNHVGGVSFVDHQAFNFDVAEAHGQAGHLIIVAGWCDSGPMYNVVGERNGLSHASLLVAHLADDSFVIWNVWKGRFETYSRAQLAPSLYEMVAMTTTNTGGSFLALTDAEQTELLDGVRHLRNELGVPILPGGVAGLLLAKTENLVTEIGLDANTGKLTPGGVGDVLTTRTAQIMVALDALQTAIAALQAVAFPPGPAGPKGDAGPAGPKGDPGKDGAFSGTVPPHKHALTLETS